jgi:hypothetical protein
MARTKRPSVEQLVAEARLAALRQDPRVVVHERTIFAPYVPKIKGTPQTGSGAASHRLTTSSRSSDCFASPAGGDIPRYERLRLSHN